MNDKINSVDSALANFVTDSEMENATSEELLKNSQAKKTVLDEREGLIERVDRVFVTKDGRQLLCESLND